MTRTRRSAWRLAAMLGTASAIAAGAGVAQEWPMTRPSVNLHGQPGLIDLPSAEMMPDGQVTGTYAYFEGQERRSLTFQILPRVSGTLRYATIADWVREGEPDDDLNNRSFDLTFQLLREDGWRPSVALGFRDILGAGVYSSEYLVASKRVVPSVTVSAGLGWGRLAGLGGVSNPVCEVLGGGACDRPDDVGPGGTPAANRFFQGDEVAPFAGVEWRTPVEGLTFKAEYSPDAYVREQESPAAEFERRERLNVGAEYRLTEGITLGGYWMYGSALGVNLNVSANPFRPLQQQDVAPGPIPVTARPAGAPMTGSWADRPEAVAQVGAALAGVLEGEGVRLDELRVTADTAEAVIVNRRYNQDPLAIGRTVRVLQVGLPPSVQTFRITLLRDGLPVTTVAIDRSTYEGLIDRPLAGERMWEAAAVESARLAPDPEATVWRQPDLYPSFGWSVSPAPFLVFQGQDEPLRAGLNLHATGTYRVTPALSFTGGVSQLLLGRSSDPGPEDTELQPVRSEAARYYAGRAPDLRRLTGDYVSKITDDVYVRGSAGYIERMFAGVSGEVLWKPSDAPLGLGLELNYVAQRDNDGLGFDQYDYRVATGHASLYWDTGFNGFEVQLDAGRYLAGDWGASLGVQRQFANGWAFGAFATVTDDMPESAREGDIATGVTLEIPLRWAVPFETRSSTRVAIQTAARDAGARLQVANRLYPTVRDLDRSRLERNWGAIWQ